LRARDATRSIAVLLSEGLLHASTLPRRDAAATRLAEALCKGVALISS